MSVRDLGSRGLIGMFVAGVAAAGALQPPAHAAPPANDEPSAATRIPSLPALIEADTREATPEAERRRCVRTHSVWYTFRPTTSGPQRITTIGSSYDTILAVFAGRRAPRTQVACNDDAAGLQSAVQPGLVAGRRYWIAVSACCGGRRTQGGDLVLRLPVDEPPARVTLDVTEVTAGAVSGRLRVEGTVTCATPSVVSIRMTASQRSGDGVARGRGFRFLRLCHTDPVVWRMRIDTETGWAFVAGPVALDVRAIGDDGFSRSRVDLSTNEDATELASGRRLAR